jgi:hypothetical protein
MEIVKNWKIHILAVVVVIIVELIGTKRFEFVILGLNLSIVLFPMLYAMIFGGFISWPKLKILNEKDMGQSGNVLMVLLILLMIKIGLGMGPELPRLMDAKFALILQEFGHFFGTIILGMPIAVALGMGKEAIGATYSLDREGNVAIIAEKYGLDSPEGRGVMAMYICGTVFGAVWVGILVGVVGGMGIFHPYALAMGVGVGSGSMLAAGMGALINIYPSMEGQIRAYAGAANLMSGVLGIYFALFVSLPIAIRFHRILSKLMGRKEEIAVEGGEK